MIIRHGEKPGTPDDDSNGGPNLSILGSARAAALPSLFTPDPTQTPATQIQLTCDLTGGSAAGGFSGAYGNSNFTVGQSKFQTPNFLFATAPSNSSSRPVETITPLLSALQFYLKDPNLTINDTFTNDNTGIQGIKSEILNNPNTYGGKAVLIAWHHGTIPALTEAFGVPASQLPWPKWPGNIFDLVFYITWPNNQATLDVYGQGLLFGDTASPAS